jgi:hypothetical protein
MSTLSQKAWGGRRQLLKASCKSCADITSQIERACLQNMFGDARQHLGIRGKKRRWKQRKPPLIGIKKNGNEEWLEIPIEDHPGLLFMPMTAPGGMPIGVKGYNLVPDLEERERRLDDKYKDWMGVQYHDPHAFCRMLAKIAHAHAVAELGMDAFEPLLPDLILGKSEDASHFVGSGDMGMAPQVPHQLEVGQGLGREDLKVVQVQLFAYLNTPVYLIVVGRVKSSPA